MPDNLPMALSVEKVRHEMLRGILVPRELVNEALKTTASKLHARETKFFSFRGRVTDKRDIDDHAVQLQAADQIFSLAGLYSRERESLRSTPGVALEVDPSTGVIRIVVGVVETQGALPVGPFPPVGPSPAEECVEALALSRVAIEDELFSDDE